MKLKGILLSIISLIFFINCLFIVNAIGVSTNTTLNNSNISGTHLVYASLTTGCAADCYVGNVTFKWSWYNGTQVNISTDNNNSVNDTTFSVSWDTTTFADGKNGTLNFSVYAYSGSVLNGTNATVGIDLDNTPPTIAVYNITGTGGFANGTDIKTNATLTGSIFPNNLSMNISVTDATLFLDGNWTTAYCIINVGGGLNHSVPFLANRWCNSTDINITDLTDGNKTINIWVNDSINTRANLSLIVQIDATQPTATASCSPTTVQTGDTHPCSCGGSDSGSGLRSTSASSTSGSVTSTSSTGTFTYTCTATDNGGLTKDATATYTITQSTGSGAGGGSGGGSVSNPKPQVFSFSKVTPGAASVAKYIDPDLGVKEIQVEVNNEAQSVKVTVTKYDSKPASVSVEKEGKIYQYMKIDVTNVQDKLNKAKISAKVKKSWTVSNGVDKNNIVISKFDETNSKWNELSTTYTSEDDTYYYYEAEVSSFSYFSISGKAVTEEEPDVQAEPVATTEQKGTNFTWLWIVIAVIVVGLVWFSIKKKR